MSYDLYYKSFIDIAKGVNFAVTPELLPENHAQFAENIRCQIGKIYPFYFAYDLDGRYASFNSPDGQVTLIRHYSYNSISIMIIADVHAIYRWSTGTLTFVDISESGVEYSSTQAFPWSTVIFNDVLYLANKIDGLKKYNGTGLVTPIGAGPKAHFLTVFHEHLIALGDGNDDKGLNWSAEFSDTDWTPVATNDAGGFDFTDTESGICCVVLGDQLIVYRQHSIGVINFIGGDLVFMYRPTVDEGGACSGDSVVVLPGRHIVFGPNRIYEYRGGGDINYEFSLPIHRAIYGGSGASGIQYTAINKARLRECRTYHNTKEHTIQFVYWSLGNLGGEFDGIRLIVMYNYEEGTWVGPFEYDHDIECFGIGEVNTQDVIDSIEDIIDENNTIIDNFAEEASYFRANLFASGTNLYVQADDSLGFLGTAPPNFYYKSGFLFLGTGATDRLNNSVTFPLDSIFRIESIRLMRVANRVYTSTGCNLRITITGYRHAGLTNVPMGTTVIDIPLATTTPSDIYPCLVSGRYFVVEMEATGGITKPSGIELLGYQLAFTEMGRR